MPPHSSAADAFGVATIVLVNLLCLASVFCVFYVLYFRSQVRQDQSPALRDFNAVWVVRILLIVLAMLWGLIELLRLPLLRHNGRIFASWKFEQQATLCRIYTLCSFGILEPCFFLMALLLVQGSISDAPSTPREKWNEKAIGLVLLWCLPVLVLQVFFVLISPNLSFLHGYAGDGRSFGLPTYFTRSYDRGLRGDDKAMCAYPLFSTLVLGLFSCIYNCCFLWQGWRMIVIVINKRLQTRVCSLVLSLGMLLPVQVLFMGFSVLSTPGTPLFELIAFLGFLSVLLCISVGEGILVVQPIADALAVRRVFDSLPTRTSDLTIESFVVPLSTFGMEEDSSHRSQELPLIKANGNLDCE